MSLPPPGTDRYQAAPPAAPPTHPSIEPPIETTPAIGSAVNEFSRAVSPREQYPLHHDYLIRDLYQHNINPADWQIIAGDEVRLDENGMDIEFTLLKKGTEHIWRRRINVQSGRLVSIVER